MILRGDCDTKKLISLLLTLALLLTAIPAGAYSYEKDYSQAVSSKLAFRKSAVKWDGKSAPEPNTYYYTASAINMTKSFTVPESSVLEVRKNTLRISKGAVLTVNGGLIIDYNGKVNPLSGTLEIAESGWLSCYGTLSVSKNGTLSANNEAVIYDGGLLAVKGTVSASETGKVINGGTVKKYRGAKIRADIINPLNITDELDKALADKADGDEVNVTFRYYDSEVMKSTELNGRNYLDLTVELQNNLYVPKVASEQLFGGTKGSYKQLTSALSEKSTFLLRYMKTRYSGSKGYSAFTGNPYFSNVTRNENYEAETSTELNYYTLSDNYNQLLETRIQLADKLNENLLASLQNDVKIPDAAARNVYANGYGVFSARLSKKQIYTLAADSRFMFLSLTDESNVVDGADKLYLSNGFGGYFSLDELEAYKEEYGGEISVVLKNDICKPCGFSNEATKCILKYTEFNNIDFSWIYYDTSIADYRTVKDFGESTPGMFRFHSFTDDLMNQNGSTNLNRIYSAAAAGVGSYVYHRVSIDSADDIWGLIRDMDANPHYKRNCSAAKLADHT